MSRILSIFISVLVLGILVTACYLPVFDLSQSMGTLILDRMEKRGVFGPVKLTEVNGNKPQSIQFFPAKAAAPDHGLAYFQWKSEAKYYGIKKEGENFSATQPWNESIYSLDSFSPPPLVVAYTGEEDTDYAILRPYVSGEWMSINLKFITSSFMLSTEGNTGQMGWRFGAGAVLQAPVDPLTFNTAGASLHALCYNDSEGLWYWTQATGVSFQDPIFLEPFTTNSAAIPDRGLMAGAGAVSGPDSLPVLFYTQYLGDGEFKSYRWPSSAIMETSQYASDIKGRVVTGLTSGEILVEDGDWMRVHNSAGKLKYSFPAGDLRFCYEWMNDQGDIEILFSLTSYQEEDQMFTASVYGIRADKLETLAW